MTNEQMIAAFAEAANKTDKPFYKFISGFADYVKYNRDVNEADITNDDMKRYLDAYMNL